MKIYRLAKGWTIFVYIFMVLVIAGLGWGIFNILSKGNPNETVYWLGPTLMMMGIGLSIYLIFEVKKDTFVIAKDRIYTTGTFYKRSLNLDEIRGFSVNEKYIFIEPTTKGKKRVRVSTYFGRTDDILAWLGERYPDLDELNAQQEHEEILSNPEFGWTEEQREHRLTQARRQARVVNVFGTIAAAWAFFWPHPYFWSMIAPMAMFMVGLVVTKLSNGLIRIEEKKNSAYPSVLYGVIFTGMCVMVRALLDFNILDFKKAWMLTGVITTLLIILVGFKNSELKFKTGTEIFTSIFIAVVLMAYSFGTAVTLNGLLDTSAPEVFTVKIVSKHVSGGKVTTYHLMLEPWGDQKESEDATVSSDFYHSIDAGESVEVYRMKGELGIPWFFVAEDMILDAKANPNP
ncbi:hypothetical protein SAMN04488109_3878 [Chryseolinea serpens]|uniref:Uncharacterized protein n=1 Tax=Chryseolinea serpens TaxID=947013 RepID=A0A1M5SDQ0_9BACT|nr:twin transmembrane helix small protein [Chryseolinea serpens]SHH36591.1 hypothetical protein SAMN04488109_3878 [Chryseolinea serpens]